MLAQLGGALLVRFHEHRQELRRQPIAQDALHKQPDCADVDPCAERLPTYTLAFIQVT